MTREASWQPLTAELERWERAGRVADFWLRDDDAVAPTEALERLLGLTEAFSIPLLLAVIPAPTDEVLARRLDQRTEVAVAVHGWSHENHAPAGEKKQELGPHRPHAAVLAELATGFEKLQTLHGARFAAVLVPPWNRIDPGLAPELPPLGFEALSTFGPRKRAPIPLINSTVDIIDWRGGRGCRGVGEILQEIVGQLERSFASGGDPVGLLAHHLVHDQPAWSFLEGLFEATVGRESCRWRSIAYLIRANAASL